MEVLERLNALRTKMKEQGIDAYIVLNTDPHGSEYPCSRFKAREWISGFDGSAGIFAITQKEAALYTDGRYFIQAKRQLEGTEIELLKMNIDGALTLEDWIKTKLSENCVVGFDGKTVSVSLYNKFENKFRKNKVEFKTDIDLIDEIWKDREQLPKEKVFEHDIKFAGKTRLEKLEQLRHEMDNEEADCYLIASLDDIAWLFNFRGNDVLNTPVSYAYSFISKDKAYLFIDTQKLEDGIKQSLLKDGVILKEYDEISEFLRQYDKEETIFINPDKVSISLKNSFNKNLETACGIDITTKLKTIKNEIEIENIRNSQVRDGVVVAKLIKWIKKAVKVNEVYESDIHDILCGLRRKQENSFGVGFSTIAAYMENAAQMHYSPVKRKSAKLLPKGMLLIDTGWQYLDGTTDITRTIALGDVSEQMKRDFTLVLKSHINFAMAKFLYGATGANLDTIARKIMWEHGLDYKCGTGHGLGYFLSVHEGPQNVRMNAHDTKFEAGMIVTNEPGIYKEGLYGIRTENTVLVTFDYENENGKFMKFETISFCPIDLDLVDVSLLSDNEIEWLNNYHEQVYEKLSPSFISDISEEGLNWLKNATRKISK